jgi:hypothetical protein
MADALVMFDDGNFRAVRDGTNQALATARHAQINVLRERQQNRNRLAIGRRNDLDRVFGKVRERGFAGVNHRLGDDLVRVHRLPAAAQNRRVAGFETKAGGVRRHIRARFVNDDDHADGRGNFLQLQAVGPDALVEDFSDRVGQGGDFAQSFGHRGDTFVIEFKPVQHGRRKAGFRGGAHVERVGLFERAGVLFQRRGHRKQAGVLLRRCQPGKLARRGLGLFGQSRHLFRQSHSGRR